MNFQLKLVFDKRISDYLFVLCVVKCAKKTKMQVPTIPRKILRTKAMVKDFGNTNPTEASVVLSKSAPKTELPKIKKGVERKKRVKRTLGNYCCQNCKTFFADSLKKLESHERRCEYLQLLAIYMAERDRILVYMNENGEYCCVACKFNFKRRKDNLYAHVQNNCCPKGAVMPPRPIDPKTSKIPMTISTPKVAKQTETTKQPTKTKRRRISDAFSSTETTAELMKESNTKISSTTENYSDGVPELAKAITLSNDTYDSVTNQPQAAHTDPVLSLSHPQGMLQNYPMSYVPSYFPSYSQYAEFSPISVPFQEMVGLHNISSGT